MQTRQFSPVDKSLEIGYVGGKEEMLVDGARLCETGDGGVIIVGDQYPVGGAAVGTAVAVDVGDEVVELLSVGRRFWFLTRQPRNLKTESKFRGASPSRSATINSQ